MTTAERLLHFQQIVNAGQAAKHVTPAKREKLEHRQTVSERWAILERNQALAATTRQALLQGDEEREGAKTYAKNIESYMGTVKIPIGVAGPLRISGSFLEGEFYVPLATTEAGKLSQHCSR
jgi:hydroxymethylglutaryl-CoA reductase